MRRRVSAKHKRMMSGIAFQHSFLPGLALALGIGLLIGVERGWQLRQSPPGSRVAGVRTFAILGLLGGLVGLSLGGPLAPVALMLTFGAVMAILLGYHAEIGRAGNISATSALASIVTLVLGALATRGFEAVASVGAGTIVMLLGAREPLHRAIRATNQTDMKALLRFVLVVLVVLPLLPDAAMGPFHALNPRRLWTVVVVTAGISFAGYALSRWLGTRRGTLLNAGVGALISSTAVTLDCGRRIRDGAAGPADEAAVAVASFVMFLRGLFLVGVLAPLAFASIAALVVPAAAVAALAAVGMVWRSRRSTGEPATRPLKAPGLGLALLFASTVAVLSLITAFVEARYGSGSGAVAIALGGTVDIDAAIAAVGALPSGSLPIHLAALAIAAPILFNTLLKLGLLVGVGGWKRTKLGAASLAAAALALIVPILASSLS
jgi:uncharacterized membrane protein (DUF4010 family)